MVAEGGDDFSLVVSDALDIDSTALCTGSAIYPFITLSENYLQTR